jgi:hypothetical protein
MRLISANACIAAAYASCVGASFAFTWLSLVCHSPNFENQERPSHTTMIHHNLTKGVI